MHQHDIKTCLEASSEFLDEVTARSGVARSSLRRNLAAAAVMFLLLLASLANVGAAIVQVSVGDGGFNFSPQSVSIQVGDTVQWNWIGNGHSTTSEHSGGPDGLWDSGVQNSGFTFVHTFSAAGSFPYFCTPHGGCCGMTGTVNVASPTPTPTPTPPLPPIAKGSIRVQLVTAASGLTAPVDLVSPRTEAGGSSSLSKRGRF